MFKEIFEAKNEKESNGYRFSYTFGRSDHNAIIGKIGSSENLGATPVNSNFSIDDILSFFEKVSNGGVTVKNLEADKKFIAWLRRNAKVSKAKGL